MSKLELLPAVWNGKYTEKETALESWNSGKDFKIPGGPYCSIRDSELLKKVYHDGVYLTYGHGDLVRVL